MEKIILPTSWSEVNCGQFSSIYKIQMDTTWDELDRNVQIISILGKMPRSRVLDMSYDEIKQCLKATSFIGTLSTIAQTITRDFKIGKATYTIPLGVEKLTAGQRIDLHSFTTSQELIIENIHKIMSVLALPIGETYKGDTMEARAKIFQDNLPITIAYPIAVFFWTVLTGLTNQYSEIVLDQMREINRELIQEVASLRSGDGS